MYTRRRRKSIYTRKYVYTLFTRWLWTCDVVDCQKEVQRCRDKKSQFMWSINHNVSNTVAHYSVHREERLLLSNWKGSVSWCTHSDNQSLRDGSKAFEEIKKVYIGKSQLWPFISHYVNTSIAMLILRTNEGSSWILKCLKMHMKAEILKNVYEGLNARKCVWRLKC